jgi:hypothetical protein
MHISNLLDQRFLKKHVLYFGDSSGQGMVEYVLAIASIAMAVVAILPNVAGALLRLVANIIKAMEL